MEKLFALILSVPDVEKAFSWQTKENGGHAENAEIDTIRNTLTDQKIT
jgi:hypothetical protein